MEAAQPHPLSEVTVSPLASAGMVTIGTITPIAADGRLTDDVNEQVQLVWARLAATLQQHGSDPSRLVKLSIQVGDPAAVGPVRSYIDRRLGESTPAIVMTRGVLVDGIHVQLDAIAASPASSAPLESIVAADIVENSHLMAVDPAAEPVVGGADDGPPAFVARPVGSAVYHGFPVVDIPDREGWRLGAVSGFGDGSREGDAFVVAPDGTRAGVVWAVGSPVTCSAIVPANEERWGVFAMTVPRPMGARGELVENLDVIVAELAPRWEMLRDPAQS